MSDEHCLAVMNAEYDEHAFDCDDVDCPTCTPIANFAAAIAGTRQAPCPHVSTGDDGTSYCTLSCGHEATIVSLQDKLIAAVATWEHHRATATKLAEALEAVIARFPVLADHNVTAALVAWRDGQTT